MANSKALRAPISSKHSDDSLALAEWNESLLLANSVSKATVCVSDVKWKRMLPNLTTFSLFPVSSSLESCLNVEKSEFAFL